MPDDGLDGVDRGVRPQREELRRAVHAVTALAPELDGIAIAEVLWLAAVREGPSLSTRERSDSDRETATTDLSHAVTRSEAPDAQSAAPAFEEPVNNPASASSGATSAATREVYENIAGAPRGTAVSGHSFSTPRGSALPRSLELGRALRPFKRAWAPGPRQVLDIEATARDYAQSGELLPTLRAQPERYLDLALVVDRSPSMAVWYEVAQEFATVLHRLGAFKRVRTWDLTMDEDGRPLLHTKNTTRADARNSPATGQRGQVIVLSDCSADGWYQPEIWQLLHQWGAAVPTTLVNPLPSRLWRLTGLDLPAVRVTNPGAAAVRNTRLDYRRPWHLRFGPDADVPLTPLPVAMLTPYGLDSWARVVMSAGAVGGADFVGCDAVLVPRHGRFEDEFADGLVEGFADDDDPLSAEELITGFLASASTLAARLAVMCAPYTSMTMPLLHLVRQTMVPEATLEEVAEVVVSGLFTTSSAEDGSPMLHPRPGVQAGLEELLGADDTWRMYEALTQYVAAHAGSLSALSAAIRDPSGSVGLPAELRPFAAATVDTLRVLGALPPPVATGTPVATGMVAETAGVAVGAGSDGAQAGFGKIIIFHASTPGIGTSSTMVSAAWILASHGKRVLIAEWFPEPPSVAHHLRPFLEAPEEFSQDGLPATVAIGWDFPEFGSLDHVPDGFAPYDIDPAALREALRSSYDYVLVLIADWNLDLDSTAALNALPDVIVTCFREVDPAIAEGMLALAVRTDPPRRVFPLPMGVQKDSLHRVREDARRAFEGLPYEAPQTGPHIYWDTTGIPYRSSRISGDIPAVFIDTPDVRDSVLAAVELLVGWTTYGRITALPPFEESEHQQILALYARHGRTPLAARAEYRTDPSPNIGLLGITDSEELGEVWVQSARARLRVPIGVDGNAPGQLVLLDLNEGAAGGMGPHGLVVGEAGSGKSDLLRTLVTGLAVTHPPATLNFALVDSASDATFAGLAGLPHVSALITNLLDDLSLVDRMTDALNGESLRRRELLRAGNFSSVRDYEWAREQDAALEPLPTLLVIIDEFTEALASRPDLMDLLVTLCRTGRSLGIHLLLASKRLGEGQLRGLDTFLSYRIGLRTFSAAESRAVIGVPDAYELPPTPGSGYLRTGNEPPQRFNAAPGIIDFLTARLAKDAPLTHQIWLPPLDEPATLDEILPPLDRDPERGLCPVGWDGLGRMTVPVGVVDKPFEQRKDLLWADLSGAAGHVLVTGSPRSGKSTMARTLISSLALTHTPEEVQFFILDVGAERFEDPLSSLRELPHASGYATSNDGELVRRIVGELTALIAEREQLFRRAGLDSIAAFRSHRASKAAARIPGSRAFGDVFLVIDDWGTLVRDYEHLQEPITRLVQRGLGFGIHVVLTAGRIGHVRPTLRDCIGTRLELRLSDPFESEVNRRMASIVPTSAPGRGLTPDRLHFLGALPRIDGESVAATDQRGTADMVRQISEAWPGPAAPQVRLLPRQVTAAEVRVLVDEPRASGQTVLFGLSEADLQPVYADFRADPHFIALGESNSGKTGFLRTLAAGIMAEYTPEQAAIAVVDYRRGMLDTVTGDHLLGYTDAGPTTVGLINECAEAMRRRLAGPDVTAAQLRDRSWWRGPELFVLVDDYELVAAPETNPLSPLLEYLAQARDIGLHLVVARGSFGARGGMSEPILRRTRDLGSPTLLLPGAEDDPLGGLVKTGAQELPGRGVLVHRRSAPMLVQVAWTPPASD